MKENNDLQNDAKGSGRGLIWGPQGVSDEIHCKFPNFLGLNRDTNRTSVEHSSELLPLDQRFSVI